jgi:low affinity Fe/Cu permease
MNDTQSPTMPSSVSDEVGFFDRFATAASKIASRAVFFVFCVLLVVIWAPSILLLHSIDTWQLIINTATTIITFLMVALLQNSQTRSDQAVQHKLNALAEGIGELMGHLSGVHDIEELRQARLELRDAIGLENRESTSKNGDDAKSAAPKDDDAK